MLGDLLQLSRKILYCGPGYFRRWGQIFLATSQVIFAHEPVYFCPRASLQLSRETFAVGPNIFAGGPEHICLWSQKFLPVGPSIFAVGPKMFAHGPLIRHSSFRFLAAQAMPVCKLPCVLRDMCVF